MSQKTSNQKAYETPKVSILLFTFENTLADSTTPNGIIPTDDNDWSNE